MAEVDTALGQVVGGHFQRHAVAGQDADAVLAHAARRVGADFDAVVQFDAIAAVGQHFVHDAIQFDQFFFRHQVLLVKGGRRWAPYA
ncbi:Uncharacterised protein [Bordetella pertussis]|nr:Uncharacterised protein [Bordetella pertussis]